MSINFPLCTTEPGSFPKNCSILRGFSRKIKIFICKYKSKKTLGKKPARQMSFNVLITRHICAFQVGCFFRDRDLIVFNTVIMHIFHVHS